MNFLLVLLFGSLLATAAVANRNHRYGNADEEHRTTTWEEDGFDDEYLHNAFTSEQRDAVQPEMIRVRRHNNHSDIPTEWIHPEQAYVQLLNETFTDSTLLRMPSGERFVMNKSNGEKLPTGAELFVLVVPWSHDELIMVSRTAP